MGTGGWPRHSGLAMRDTYPGTTWRLSPASRQRSELTFLLSPLCSVFSFHESEWKSLCPGTALYDECVARIIYIYIIINSVVYVRFQLSVSFGLTNVFNCSSVMPTVCVCVYVCVYVCTC